MCGWLVTSVIILVFCHIRYKDVHMEKRETKRAGASGSALRKTFSVNAYTSSDLDKLSKESECSYSEIICSLLALVAGRPAQGKSDEFVRRKVRKALDEEEFQALVDKIAGGVSKRYKVDEQYPNLWVSGKIGIYATTRVRESDIDNTLYNVGFLILRRDLKRIFVVSPTAAVVSDADQKIMREKGVEFVTQANLVSALKRAEQDVRHLSPKKASADETETKADES